VQNQDRPRELRASEHTHTVTRSYVEQSGEKIEEQVKVVRMFTVIQKGERESGKGEAKKREEVIDRSRKCCNIMRHAVNEYPVQLVDVAKSILLMQRCTCHHPCEPASPVQGGLRQHE